MRNTSYCRKVSLMGYLLLVSLTAGVASADDSSTTVGSHLSLPGVSSHPLADLSMDLSKNLSIGTSYAEGASFDVDMWQGHSGASGISRVAKAYLDYTFFSRRTGNLSQNLQGRVGVVNKSGLSAWPEAPFYGDHTGQSNIGRLGSVRDISGYRADNGFMASLEWRLDAPGFANTPAFNDLTWGEVLQVSFFADYGKAFSNGTVPVDAVSAHGSRRGLSSVGIGTGLRFSLPGRLTANLKAAYAMDGREPNDVGVDIDADPDSSRAQYWFDFSYNF
ncbi:MAG: hypothetical protein KJO08_05625 [Gammaproteobacteria bacterium]|nr:hypothetical protein [Gammaproteobacteria bacterium]NNJ84800.1 hypothetical protein [Gammaproteobacteria bacterium]